RFWFDSRWISDPSCDDIIANNFNHDSNLTCNIALKNCTTSLTQQLSALQANQQSRAINIKHRLEKLTTIDRSEATTLEESTLLHELDLIWKSEEENWRYAELELESELVEVHWDYLSIFLVF
ncbi:hypothetical protein LINPERHAP1_LOCUS30976, partial [Linum perenne]